MGYYTLTETNHAERGQRQIEPILMRLTKVRYLTARIEPVRFQPQRLHAITCTRPMVYGTNRSPRDRMRHQVQLGEGAPAWRGRMPTDRYQVIG